MRADFFGKGWSAATPEQVPAAGFDRAVSCSVSGPEPGYIGTALMFITLARFVLEEGASLPLTVPSPRRAAPGPAAIMSLGARSSHPLLS